MKKIIIALAIIAQVSCADKPEKTDFSQEALAEKLVTIEGGQIAFGDIIKKNQGKPIVIEIWASWCGDCIKAMPDLRVLQANNPDVAYIFVSMDRSDDDWKSGIARHQVFGDHYFAPDGMKGKFGQAVGVDWIPRYIIIDKEGKVALYRAIEKDFHKMDTLLKTLK